MRALRMLVLSATVAAATVACVEAPRVVQGTVVRVDIAGQELVVRDDNAPHQELVLSLRDAEVGADPEVADTVRIAYLERDGRASAVRVMNLTKQAELSGKGK